MAEQRVHSSTETPDTSIVHRPSSTVIIGLGNPILGDDGVGWQIAQEVEKSLSLPPFSTELLGKWGEPEGGVVVECLALGGITLMEHLIGYERAILVDALNTGQYPQGAVVTFTLDDLVDLTHGHSASAHDTSLKTALALGRCIGEKLPDDENVFVVAVEARHIYDFGEKLSGEIAAAVPEAVKSVLNLLQTIEGEKPHDLP
jgi:hydrogenase maturation protease